MSHPGTRLLLIRHAEVEARYQKVFGGAVDMDLSPRGHEQAVTLASCLQSRPYDTLYASPMKRVQQTLAPLLRNGGPRPIILPGLREVDFGSWTGHGWEAIQENFGVRAHTWLEQLERGAIAGAEDIHAYRERVNGALQEIVQNNQGRRVAVFCHGGVIRMVLAILLELPYSRTGMFESDYTSITELENKSARWEIQLLNFTPWRDLPA